VGLEAYAGGVSGLVNHLVDEHTEAVYLDADLVAGSQGLSAESASSRLAKAITYRAF